MRFLGTIDSKTDAKGRVFLPASFRKVLSTAGAERLVLRKDIFQPCLVLYPDAFAQALEDRMGSAFPGAAESENDSNQPRQ